MLRSYFVAVIVILLTTSNLTAQSTNATITGRITDQLKAPIAGARIVATNVDTGVQQAASTGPEGMYSIGALIPGSYKLEVERTGFKTVVRPDLVLHVQDVASINFEMAIGAVSESITVSGGTPLVDIESAAVSTVVDRQFAENLPMNGRSFQSLIQLTPGVVTVPSNEEDGGQFSINGQRSSANYWMVDGVSANIGIGISADVFGGNGLGGALGSFSALGGTNSLVSVDAMEEFRIQTSTYAPEFGRMPGGQISIVTRSGSNRWHGSAFDYFRNDILDSNDWFANFANLPKPKERQNDFGGVLSGPIVRDKTFFFFSYEGLRLRLPQTSLTTVPDAAARQNAVPNMQRYLNAFPSPNGADLGGGIAEFNASYSNPGTLDAYSLRVDHKLSNRWTLFGRYNYSPSGLTQRGFASLSPLSTLNSNRIITQTTTAGATTIISPNTVNDLRLNYSRTSATSYFYQDRFAGAAPLISLPFPSPYDSRDGALFLQFLSLRQGILDVGQQGHELQRQLNLVDSLSLRKGSHSLKYGIDYRRLSPLYDPYAYRQLVYFSDIPSAENGNFLVGGTYANSAPTFLFRNLSLYGQDVWRLSTRLTLTYGVRWDVDFVPQVLSGPRLPAATGLNSINLSNLALAPVGTSPYRTKYWNFAPRFGVAYQLSQSQKWQTMIRGGFGVFYDLASSEAGNNLGIGNYPYGSVAFYSGGTFPLSPSLAAPLPITIPSPSNPTAGVFVFDTNLKLPYTLEWNVALEQAMGKQQTLSASYIGSAGRRLLQTEFQNTPNTSFGQVELLSNNAISDYQALQAQYKHRLSKGLQALASYTWSHSIDTASAASVFINSNDFVAGQNRNANRGPSAFDIRNMFSAGLTYDFPSPKVNAFAKAVLSGWSTENFFIARSAPPVDVFDVNFFLFKGGVAGDIRPDLVPGQPLYLYGLQCGSVFQAIGELSPGQGCPGGSGFNPKAFTPPPTDTNGNALRQGDLGRNALRAFGATQWDFAFRRDFPVHELFKLQFRTEMFNVLNHPNFGPPNGQFGTGGFGLSSQRLGQSLSGGNVGAGGFSALYQLGGPRSIQLALRLLF
jgi:carboxypeptidase family protein